MRKLFILGVDGATFHLVEPWARQGLLPGFARLMEQGSHAPLQSSVPPLSPVAWTTIASGVNPGKHGIYDFMIHKYVEGMPQPVFHMATGGHRRTKAFWEMLSEAGRKVIVANMPCSFPPDPVNGLMISGWDAARERQKGFYPASLYQEIMDQCGDYYIVPIDLIPKKEMDKINTQSNRRLAEVLEAMTAQRDKVFRYLARTHEWDVFFGVFTETDTVQHRFWSTLGDDPATATDTPVFRVYQGVDRFVRFLLDEYGDDIDIMVVSDHGFGPVETGVDLNTVLEQGGLLAKRHSLPRAIAFNALKHMRGMRRHLKNLTGKKWMPERLAGFKPRHLNIDFLNSKVFFEGTYPYFHVLDHVQDKAAVYEQLKKTLLGLEYQGHKVFRAVQAREERFSGPYVQNIPDFVAVLNDGFEAAGAEVFMPYRKRREVFTPHVWTGNHTEYGVFLWRGQGPGGDPGAVNVQDIAPSLLAQQGLAVPAEMDGSVAPCVAAGAESSDYVIYKDPSVAELKQEDQEAIEERLKALGYM
jgi:predicted AlkP superfamily phosphohydrolase/phosphomutase